MHLFLTSSLAIAMLSIASFAHAEADATIAIPDKINSDILQRHPKAHDMQAAYETHFGQKLLEVEYKDENDEKVLELFTVKGHLLTNEMTLQNMGEVSPTALETLKLEFPKYTLNKTELIVNPNGVGEEYEIYLHANGSDWKVSINDRGKLLEKLQLTP